MPTVRISCSARLRHFTTIFGHRAVQVNHKNHRSSSYRCPGRSPGSFENSLGGSNCRRDNEICLYTSRQWPRRRGQLVAEAAQRNVERGADEMREHIGGCTNACRRYEATYPPLALGYIGDKASVRRFSKYHLYHCMGPYEGAGNSGKPGRNNYPP